MTSISFKTNVRNSYLRRCQFKQNTRTCYLYLITRKYRNTGPDNNELRTIFVAIQSGTIFGLPSSGAMWEPGKR